MHIIGVTLSSMRTHVTPVICATTHLVFSTACAGVTETVDLVPNGGEVTVDNKNLPDYLDAQLKYRTMHRVQLQLTEFLKGFYDVVPEPLLSIFDFQVRSVSSVGARVAVDVGVVVKPVGTMLRYVLFVPNVL
jgi:hypothetical protein